MSGVSICGEEGILLWGGAGGAGVVGSRASGLPELELIFLDWSGMVGRLVLEGLQLTGGAVPPGLTAPRAATSILGFSALAARSRFGSGELAGIDLGEENVVVARSAGRAAV